MACCEFIACEDDVPIGSEEDGYIFLECGGNAAVLGSNRAVLGSTLQLGEAREESTDPADCFDVTYPIPERRFASVIEPVFEYVW